jgi:hypothetical protein
VAEASELESTQAARATYETNKARQRAHLRPTTAATDSDTEKDG